MAQTDETEHLPENLNDLMKKETFIPGWPNGATMKIKLGKRDIYLPFKSKQGLLEMKRRKALVTCHIHKNGKVSFELKSNKIHSLINGLLASSILSAVGVTWTVFQHPQSPTVLFALFISCLIVLPALVALPAGLIMRAEDADIIKQDFETLTTLSLFRQFNEEIMFQVRRCLPLAKAKQEVAVEILKEAALVTEATLRGERRLAESLGTAEDGPEIQPTNPFSEDGGSTDGQPSVLQRPEKSELEN